MSAFADTSFLVSLYVLDANSVRASHVMKRAALPLLLTPLCELELMNALQLRLFRKELSRKKAEAASSLIREDMENGILEIRALPSGLYERAKALSRTYTPHLGTRTLDVLHVASALALGAEIMYTFDAKQSTLAKAAGLKTVPASHAAVVHARKYR